MKDSNRENGIKRNVFWNKSFRQTFQKFYIGFYLCRLHPEFAEGRVEAVKCKSSSFPVTILFVFLAYFGAIKMTRYLVWSLMNNNG